MTDVLPDTKSYRRLSMNRLYSSFKKIIKKSLI